MNAPINHHYVSECHLKQFFNSEENKIFLYDKQLSNFYWKSGTKKIFSLNHLNTRLTEQGIDQSSMELELRVLFEENFSKHLKSVKRLYNDHSLVAEVYNDLNFLTLMALVGEYRNPEYKSGLDVTLQALDDHLISRGFNVPKKQQTDEVLFSNLKGYIEVGLRMLATMDPLTFAIVAIRSDDHFIVPDTSGFLVRENLDTGYVMQIGLPVSDKLFILGRSKRMGHYPTTLVEITENDDKLVFKINTDLANFAYKTVACKDEAFLKKTISKIKTQRFTGQHFSKITIGSPEKMK